MGMGGEVIWDAVAVIATYAYTQLLNIPGMSVFFTYIKDSYQNDPFRVGLEALLVFFTVRYLWSNPKETKIELSEKEVDELVAEWEPEPLVNKDLLKEFEEPVEIISSNGMMVRTKEGQELINLSSPNYLGLANTTRLKQIAIDTVKTYGVGTCGPAGFYGTLDVHQHLERELARVLGTESGIIYAQGFAAVSSVIPAFCKRADVIVADEHVGMAILKGIQISRSRVYWFKHNDVEDLERILRDIDEGDRKAKRPLTRRFIIVEGLYGRSGDIAPLRNLVELKQRFKYRLLVDESNSLGALGNRGLGLADHYGIPNSDIDIIVGNMAGVLGSAGGFCVGSEAVIDHQRLSSQAYCFSASLPAFLAKCGLETLLEIEANPILATTLAENVKLFKSLVKLPATFELVGDPVSPLMLLRLTKGLTNPTLESTLINDLCKDIRRRGVLVTRPAVIEREERLVMRPAVKIVLSAGLTHGQIHEASQTILAAIADSKIRNF